MPTDKSDIGAPLLIAGLAIGIPGLVEDIELLWWGHWIAGFVLAYQGLKLIVRHWRD